MPKFIIPDPNDRSVNKPSMVVDSAQVLGYYNQENSANKKRVVESVQKWYKNHAKKEGWKEASFDANNQCVLKAEVQVL